MTFELQELRLAAIRIGPPADDKPVKLSIELPQAVHSDLNVEAQV
jgi:hypothetical protein